jgi:hypothetical protein
LGDGKETQQSPDPYGERSGPVPIETFQDEGRPKGAKRSYREQILMSIEETRIFSIGVFLPIRLKNIDTLLVCE